MNILYIEDDTRMQDLIASVFEGKGSTVSLVASYTSAETMMSHTTFDVVICDWDLGLWDKLNGGEIVRKLRQAYPEPQYIIFSGLDREVDDGVEFVSKGNPLKLIELLNES